MGHKVIILKYAADIHFNFLYGFFILFFCFCIIIIIVFIVMHDVFPNDDSALQFSLLVNTFFETRMTSIVLCYDFMRTMNESFM